MVQYKKDTERKHIQDHGGRRSGFERRQFSYSGYIPERRELQDQDRRAGIDRRSGLDRRIEQPPADSMFIEMRSGKERRSAFLNI